MTKRMLKITGLALAISTALVSYQTVLAGDVEVILPAATDAFTVDQPAGTELMRVNGDGNVGIGTTSPTQNLEVAGRGVFGGGDAAINAVDQYSLNLNSDNSTGLSGTRYVVSNAVPAVNRIWSITGVDTLNATPHQLFSFQSEEDGASTLFANNRDLYFRTGVDHRVMSIQRDTGNVGIGTTTPSVKLHVVDDDAAYQTQFLIENKNASIPNIYEYKGGYAWQKTAVENWNGEPRFMMARSRGTLDAPTANQDGDFMGQIEFRAYDGGTHRRGASIRAEVDGTVAASNMPGSLHFLTEEEGGSDLVERMVIKNDGNVGIGTTAPSEILEIHGDTDADLDMYSFGTDNTTFHIGRANGTKDAPTLLDPTNNTIFAMEGMGYDGSTYRKAGAIHFSLDGTAGAGDMPGSISFHTTEDGASNYTRRMIIKNDGNIGIGTPTPLTNLHINFTNDTLLVDPTTGAAVDPASTGGLLIENTSTIKGSGAVVRLKSNVTGGAEAGIMGRSANPDRNGRGSLDLWTEDPDGTRLPRMTVNYDGNVGIGTTIPTHPLELASGAHVTSAGVWTDASDIAKKENIKKITYGLDTVMKLKPSQYDYKTDGSHSLGFIAQEIEKIIPEVVSGEEGSKGVAYGALTAVLAKAIQQQQAIIEKQDQRIEALEAKIK